jgi:hypothetical protein
MRDKNFWFYAFFCLALSTINASEPIAGPNGDNPSVEVPDEEPFNEAEINEIAADAQAYADPAYVAGLLADAAEFQTHDFIHTVRYAREASYEAVDAFYKKILYEHPVGLREIIPPDRVHNLIPQAIRNALPQNPRNLIPRDIRDLIPELNLIPQTQLEFIQAFIPNLRIGILASDVIGLASYTTQYVVNQGSIRVVTNNLAKALATAAQDQQEQIIAFLEQKGPDRTQENIEIITDQLSKVVWHANEKIPLISAFLKYRLAHASLECIKKNFTPLPFYMHGKTRQGKAVDAGIAHIAPITSIIPTTLIDGLIHREFRTTFMLSASEKALELAKQCEQVGTIDENLLFIAAKEIAISMLFFHYSLKPLVKKILIDTLLAKKNHLLATLNHYQATQKDPTLTEDVRQAEKKECLEALTLMFNKRLKEHHHIFVKNMRSFQNLYNTIVNGIILAPVAYKIISTGWAAYNAITANN